MPPRSGPRLGIALVAAVGVAAVPWALASGRSLHALGYALALVGLGIEAIGVTLLTRRYWDWQDNWGSVAPAPPGQRRIALFWMIEGFVVVAIAVVLLAASAWL